MHKIKGFEILLVLSLKSPVSLPEPSQWRFILAIKPMMKINQQIILLYILIQCIHKVSVKNPTVYRSDELKS